MRSPAPLPTAVARRRTEPSSRKGRERVSEILNAARRVLVEKDYTQFSLRNIAASAGMHLSNLQYYLPTREAVIHALVEHVVRTYDARYEEKFRDLPATPYPRFIAILDFLIEDIRDPETRRFFIQLWALLESSDNTQGGTLLNELYAKHIDNIAGYIAELNPALSRSERQQRAAMIAAMIDGMMLMLLDADRYTEPGQPGIETAMRRQLLRIATEP